MAETLRQSFLFFKMKAITIWDNGQRVKLLIANMITYFGGI